MKYKKTLIFSFLIFTLILGLFNIRPVKSAIVDITYTLQNNILYNSNSFSYDNSFNLDNNITIYTNDYNGSYSFTNETGLSSTNITFIDVDTSNGNVLRQIINNKDGHNEVLELYDNTNPNYWNIFNNFSSSQVSGTIEYWFQTSDGNTKHFNIYIRDGTSTGIYLTHRENEFKYHDGVLKSTGHSLIANTWYHIKLDFECGAGAYLGLAPDTFYYTINGIQYGAYDFITSVDDLSEMLLQSSGATSDFYGYIDGVGYSWDSDYIINENLFPLTIFNNTLSQVSGYEFAFENINDLYSQGYGSHGLFIEGWQITGNNVKIDYDYTSLVQGIGVSTWSKYRDRVANFTVIGSGGSYLDLDNSLFITNNFINLSFSLNISHYDNNGGYIPIEFYSDSNQLLELRIYKTGGSIDFTYYDGGYNNIYSGLNVDTIYEINIMLNLETDQAFISLYENYIQIDYTIIPLFITNEPELSEIIIGVEGSVGNHIGLMLDSVGVHSNGIVHIGQDNTFGYTRMSTIDKWKAYEYNLFSIIAEGNLQIYREIWFEVVLGHGTESSIIESFRIHNNTLSKTNIYGLSTPSFPIWFESSLLIYTKQNITYSYTNIEGVSLNEGGNKYWLKYTFYGVDDNENYFYVDNNNRLQFTHTSNDTNLEYIQAEFDINDILSSEYAIKFKSNIDYNAFGFFRVKFTDISNFIPLPIYDATTRVFITQNKTISSFIIIITDDNIDSISGLTEGYVSEIELLFITGIGVSIITSNLLTVIIPLIIIFIPTFLLSSRIGKNMIVPLMMLMSLICVATEIIPIWLFFVIIFPSSLFLFLKRKELI